MEQENEMNNYNKPLYAREKGKAIEASTEITATKGEQVMISIVTVLCMVLVVGAVALIGFGHIAIGICCGVLGIVSVVACMLVVILNPKHRQELQDNAVVEKMNIDYKANYLTGKIQDNTVVEDVTEAYIDNRMADKAKDEF